MQSDIKLVWPIKDKNTPQIIPKWSSIERRPLPGETSSWQIISPDMPASPLQQVYTVKAYRIVLKGSKKYFPDFKDNEMEAYYTESFDDIVKKYKSINKPVVIECVVISKDEKGDIFKFEYIDQIIEINSEDVVLITVYRIVYESKTGEQAYQLTVSPGVFSFDEDCDFIRYEKDLKNIEEFLQECIEIYNDQSHLNRNFKPPIIQTLKLDWLEYSHIFDN